MTFGKWMKGIKIKKGDRGKSFYDYKLVFTVLFLAFFGLLMIYSTSYYTAQIKLGSGLYYMKRQARFLIIGIVAMVVISLVDYHYWMKWTFLAYGASVLAMLLVDFTPLGIERNGEKRWLGINGHTLFQPAELVKIAIIMFTAYFLYRCGIQMDQWKNVIILGIAVGVPTLLVMRHNLSSGLIIAGIAFVMYAVASCKIWRFLACIGIALLGTGAVVYYVQHPDEQEMISKIVLAILVAFFFYLAFFVKKHLNTFKRKWVFPVRVFLTAVIVMTFLLAIAVAIWALFKIKSETGFIFLKEYQLLRIEVWLDPEAYSSDGGYQVLQGLYAIGSGGLFGKGLGSSVQKLGFVPESQNDMIFAIICEELGLFGAICLILLFFYLCYRLVSIALNAPDFIGSMLAIGVMAHMAIQVILNIAVVTNCIPNTGITLPFISYGGTSLCFSMAEIGLGLGVSKQIKPKEEMKT